MSVDLNSRPRLAAGCRMAENNHQRVLLMPERALREGVSFLPGKFFAVSRPQPHSLRLSFAGLEPEQILAGIAILGRLFKSELERAGSRREEPAAALV